MSGMPQMEKVNWKRIREKVFRQSVRIPAPVFFLIFFAISWACFTLYFKAERNARLIDQLLQRQAAMEAHLGELTDQARGGPTPEDEEEMEMPPQILEM